MIKKYLVLGLVLIVLVGCSTNPKDESVVPPKEEVVQENYEKIPFELKGISYNLPVRFTELNENGWKPETNIDYEIDANTIITNQFLRNGNNIIKVTYYNPDTKEAKPMREVLIGAIEAENRTFGRDVAVDIKIHEGITFMTPLEEIEESLGVYAKDENEVFDTYTFEHNNVAKTTVMFHRDGRDGNESRWLGIQNFRALSE